MHRLHASSAGRILRFVVLVWVLAGASDLSSQVGEERAVLSAVQAMFDAMEARNGDALSASMLPEGHFVAVRDGRSSWTGRDDFAARLEDAPRPFYERIWDPEIRIDGSVASVWAPYDFYRGSEFSHCGTDAFLLARTPEGWKVSVVSYTVQQPPICDRHPEGPPLGVSGGWFLGSGSR